MSKTPAPLKIWRGTKGSPIWWKNCGTKPHRHKLLSVHNQIPLGCRYVAYCEQSSSVRALKRATFLFMWQKQALVLTLVGHCSFSRENWTVLTHVTNHGKVIVFVMGPKWAHVFNSKQSSHTLIGRSVCAWGSVGKYVDLQDNQKLAHDDQAEMQEAYKSTTSTTWYENG